MIPRNPITVLGKIPYMPKLFPVAISISSMIQNNATRLAISKTRFLMFMFIRVIFVIQRFNAFCDSPYVFSNPFNNPLHGYICRP